MWGADEEGAVETSSETAVEEIVAGSSTDAVVAGPVEEIAVIDVAVVAVARIELQGFSSEGVTNVTGGVEIA